MNACNITKGERTLMMKTTEVLEVFIHVQVIWYIALSRTSHVILFSNRTQHIQPMIF